ncbi:hypothetical protein BJ322DRAFT_1080810 [Thelephora terrestris]|uniref:Uncharacterized protein n=1 Tax=Thelephora terrestris TaxID=56493 RepID=A0A9P6H8Q6_9AGAM|nr:hypothetical protein BJ322DRAFT_1080810 [Thelephora terrestris]
MSFLLPLAILSLSAIAAPVTGWAPRSNGSGDLEAPIHLGASGSSAPRGLGTTSLASSTSVDDSTSLTETNLDTELSSILKSLGSSTDTSLGTWVYSDDLSSYLGTGTTNQLFTATSLVIHAGEDPEAWACIPDGETGSQTIAGLESSSWILLDDLACSLNKDASVPITAILVYRLDGSSDAVVYVSLTDPQSTMSTLSLDHPIDTFLCTDIPGISSDLGLGYDLDTATSYHENLSSDPRLDTSTRVGYETDLSALGTNTNIAADSTSDLSTSTPSSLYLATDTNYGVKSPSNLYTSTSSSLGLATDSDTVDSSLNSSLDADLASGPSDFNGLGVSPSPCP